MVSSRREQSAIAGILAGGVGLVFLAAAVAKVVHAPQFLAVVLFMLPGVVREAWVAQVGVGAVVAVEAAVSGLLLAGLRTRAVLGGTMALVGLLSLALVVLVSGRDAPACGCFGALIEGERGGAAFGIVRNIGLMGVLGWLWKMSPR